MDYLPTGIVTAASPPRPQNLEPQRTSRSDRGTESRLAMLSHDRPTGIRECTPLYPWLMVLPSVVFSATAYALVDAEKLSTEDALRYVAVALLLHNLGALLAGAFRNFAAPDLLLQSLRVALPLIGAVSVSAHSLELGPTGMVGALKLFLPSLGWYLGIAVGAWALITTVCHRTTMAMKGSLWMTALRFVGCFVLATLYVGALVVHVRLNLTDLDTLLVIGATTAVIFVLADASLALPIQIAAASYLLFRLEFGGDVANLLSGVQLVLVFALMLCLPVMAGWFIFGRKRHS